MFLGVEYPQQLRDYLLPFLRPSSVSSDSVGYLSSFFMSVGAVWGLEFPSWKEDINVMFNRNGDNSIFQAVWRSRQENI